MHDRHFDALGNSSVSHETATVLLLDSDPAYFSHHSNMVAGTSNISIAAVLWAVI